MIQSDPPGIHVLGKTWEFGITIADGQAPKVLTGGTLTMAIGLSPAQVSLTKEATIADQEAQPGQATVVFLPAETATLTLPPGGRLYYQVDLSFDPENVDAVATGFIYARESLI